MRITRRSPIDGVQGMDDAAGVAVPSSPSVPPSARSGGDGGSADTVDLSEAARLRQRLHSEVGDPTAIAADRVAYLRTQIAAGRFEPAPRATAERLLAELAGDLLA